MVEPRKPRAARPRKPPATPLVEGERGELAQTQTDQGVRQQDQGAMMDAQGHRQDEQGLRQDEQGLRQTTQGETQDTQGLTQIAQGLRQTTQGETQDDQGLTQVAQGHTQDDQGITQDDQGHRQDTQGMTQDAQGLLQTEQGMAQARQGVLQGEQANAIAAQSLQILAITDGVGLLASSVETLNAGVYDKNEIAKTRNRLLVGAGVAFVVLSLILAGLLWSIRGSARAETARAMQRENEATESRRQLADCQLPPGRMLDDGYVNPGVCFKESAERTKKFIDDATARIEDDFRRILAEVAEATAANTILTAEVRKAAAAQAQSLRAPPPQRPAPTAVSPTTVVQQASAPTSPPAPQRAGVDAVVCSVLSLLAACQ